MYNVNYQKVQAAEIVKKELSSNLTVSSGAEYIQSLSSQIINDSGNVYLKITVLFKPTYAGMSFGNGDVFTGHGFVINGVNIYRAVSIERVDYCNYVMKVPILPSDKGNTINQIWFDNGYVVLNSWQQQINYINTSSGSWLTINYIITHPFIVQASWWNTVPGFTITTSDNQGLNTGRGDIYAALLT